MKKEEFDNRIQFLNSPKCMSVRKAIGEVIDEMAADRVQYFAKFVAGWRASSATAVFIADGLLGGYAFERSESVLEELYYPYDLLPLLLFARLMDHMDEVEESCLRDEIVSVDAAWQKLIAAVPARFPGEDALARSIEANHAEVQRIVLDLYFGDLPPEFRPDWIRALNALKEDISRLFQLCDEMDAKKGVAK